MRKSDILFVLVPWSLFAQEPCPKIPKTGAHGLYTFLWENDFWGGSDENYTNGNRIAFTSLPQSIESIHGKLAAKLFHANCDATILYSLALGQSMYTPERDSITEAALIEDQHPYAGWAYSEYQLAVGRAASSVTGPSNPERTKDWQTLSLQVGVAGPLARQQFAQDSFHDLINDDHFLGWDNQIGNEPALLLTYEHRWQYAETTLAGPSHLEADLIPNVGASLGNVLAQVSGGFTARIGSGLAQVDLPTRQHPGASGLGLFNQEARLHWYLYLSVEGRLVAHNIFLDGNTFKESASIEKNLAVYDRLAGFALYKKRRQFAFTLVERSEEFTLQPTPHRFGSVSISFWL